MLNDRAARTYWPEGEAVGQRLRLMRLEGEPWATVVRVIQGVRRRGLDDSSSRAAYLLGEKAGWSQEMVLFMRTEGEPQTALAGIRGAVHAIDANLPVDTIKTLGERLDETLTIQRVTSTLFSVFAGELRHRSVAVFACL